MSAIHEEGICFIGNITKDGKTPELNEQELVITPILEKKNTIQQKDIVHPPTSNDIIDITPHLKEADETPKSDDTENVISSHSHRRALSETKKLMDNFREKVAVYPIYISDEGSTKLNVCCSTGEYCHMRDLSSTDQILILGEVNKKNTTCTGNLKFLVTQDSSRDFKLIFPMGNFDKDVTINIFNSNIHPRKDYSNTLSGTPVKINGSVIEKLKQYANIKSPEGITNSDTPPSKRQSLPGKNGFEIRNDIMQMAVDYGCYSKRNIDPDEIVNIAKKFYSFVENKR